jgi:hypothetical protein
VSHQVHLIGLEPRQGRRPHVIGPRAGPPLASPERASRSATLCVEAGLPGSGQPSVALRLTLPGGPVALGALVREGNFSGNNWRQCWPRTAVASGSSLEKWLLRPLSTVEADGPRPISRKTRFAAVS